MTLTVLSRVRYSTQGPAVNPDPSTKTRLLMGMETLGPRALAFASSFLENIKTLFVLEREKLLQTELFQIRVSLMADFALTSKTTLLQPSFIFCKKKKPRKYDGAKV